MTGPNAMASFLRELSLSTKQLAELLMWINFGKEWDDEENLALAKILIG